MMNALPLPPPAPRFDPARRTFLKAGVAASLLLVAGRWLPAARGGQRTAGRYAHLLPADLIMLERVIPVMLEGALPVEDATRRTAIAEILAGIDTVVDHQPPAVRGEIRDLFDLLTKTATRALVAGVWTSWEKATDDDIREFLQGWRTSRFALLRSGYVGLHDLIVGSWYSNPRAWARIGYAGPPNIA